MPARRALQMDSARHHPASKTPVPKKIRRNHASLTGTASSRTGKTITTHKQEVPQTELEKLHSKMEKSVDAFIKARKELEKILSAEGSSKQGRSSNGSPADLKTELKRHRELTSRVEASLKENKVPKHHSQGTVRMGSSYDFLKSIMG